MAKKKKQKYPEYLESPFKKRNTTDPNGLQETTCMRCQKKFLSLDRIRERICPKCKKSGRHPRYVKA